ncbi:hypothetical protein SK128_024332 [Halocaridina rubra]|uniref:BTB domain-containing protein n=1 Tax=Halocaridina rubra TaxID=373956 RepID=A0AAN8ZX35_HALRR
MAGNIPYYLLRWSDHIHNYSEVFQTLKEEDEFMDCSIACDDGVVNAHKIVLAGCSPYLRTLLRRANNPHPIIYLVNVCKSTILLLLEFIYKGQAHIPKTRLPQLIALGKSMQIKGLSQIRLQHMESDSLPLSMAANSCQRESSESVPDVINDFSPERNFVNTALPTPRVDLDRNADEETANSTNMFLINDSSTEETQNSPKFQEQQNQTIQEKDSDSLIGPRKKKRKGKCDRAVFKRNKSIESANIVLGNDEESPVSSNLHLKRKPKGFYDEASNSDEKEGISQPPSLEKKYKMRKILNAETSKKSASTKLRKKVVALNPEMSKHRGKLNSKSKTKNKREDLYQKGLPGNFKRMPKITVYRANLHLKTKLGDYALRHGIEKSQKYVLSKYGVRMRRQSLENFMALCKHKVN